MTAETPCRSSRTISPGRRADGSSHFPRARGAAAPGRIGQSRRRRIEAHGVVRDAATLNERRNSVRPLTAPTASHATHKRRRRRSTAGSHSRSMVNRRGLSPGASATLVTWRRWLRRVRQDGGRLPREPTHAIAPTTATGPGATIQSRLSASSASTLKTMRPDPAGWTAFVTPVPQRHDAGSGSGCSAPAAGACQDMKMRSEAERVRVGGSSRV